MSTFKRILSVVTIVLSLVSMSSTTLVDAATCTDWVIISKEDSCDLSSGICAWNNWQHTNFHTDHKRRSCTVPSGRQWFEYTKSVYPKGCC